MIQIQKRHENVWEVQTFRRRFTGRTLEQALRKAATAHDVVEYPGDLEIRSTFEAAQVLESLERPQAPDTGVAVA